MTGLYILFWLCVTLLVYCYAGYGLLLGLYNTLRRALSSRRDPPPCELLPVTLLVPAYNEETVIVQKIDNCLNIDYPRDLVHIIFITDGSTDNTPNLVKEHQGVTLLHQPRREGKLAALRRGMRFVTTPVVVFTDANCMLNAGSIRAMVRHYADERVGGVAGEKKVMSHKQSTPSKAEGIYWKYESFIKKQESDFNTVVGAAGELFSIRTDLFHAPDDQCILDDLVISMNVCMSGYRFRYEPGAFAVELGSIALAEEEKRKIRIGAGAWKCLTDLKQCLNIGLSPIVAFQYFSRRVLRWICPFLLIMMLLANVELVVGGSGRSYEYFLLAQVIFYSCAAAGRLLISFAKPGGVLGLPFYFVFMHFCLLRGYWRYIQGQQTVLWEKSMRQAIE